MDRASDEEIVALLRACRSARDRLIVLLMARAGLRRGELCGLRRSDVHLLPDSRLLGCEVARAHLHVVRRDNPNGAWAKSRRQRVVPLDFLVVQAFDVYEFERLAVPRAGESDFVLVNLFREPIGAPMRPDAINELIAACSRRAGIDRMVRRTSCGTRSAATWPTRAAAWTRSPPAGARVDEFVAGVSAPRPGPAARGRRPGSQPPRAGRDRPVSAAEAVRRGVVRPAVGAACVRRPHGIDPACRGGSPP